MENEILYDTPNGTIRKIDSFKGKKVLVGDYSNISFDNTLMVLESLGMEVTREKRLDNIIKRISEGEFYDAIITNNVYEFGGSGLELLKELRKLQGFSTPVVIHTISDNTNDCFTSYGFDGYLKKPIKQEDTLNVLSKLIR